MPFAQIGQHLEAVSIGQLQIKQDEVDIGMLLDKAHRLPAIGCFNDYRVVVQLLEDAAQRVANQDVVVADENVHSRRGTLAG